MRVMQERMKHGLRNSRVHRLLGDRVFLPNVWGFDQRSIAGGLALGLFIAFTPTIPFHMILCAVGAVLFRVNLFIAWIAIWVTNPVTAIPIYVAARRFGLFLCESPGVANATAALFGFEGRFGKFMKEALYLWTGCLVFSFVSAFVGYAAVRVGWLLYHWRIGQGTEGEGRSGRPRSGKMV